MAYRWDTIFLSAYISLGITITNAILEEVIIFFTKKLGIDTHTEETEYMRVFIFSITFFNSVVVILAMGAYLEVDYMNLVLNGKYRDFTNEWYIVIGSQFVMNTLVDAFSPLLTYWFNNFEQNIYMMID